MGSYIGVQRSKRTSQTHKQMTELIDAMSNKAPAIKHYIPLSSSKTDTLLRTDPLPIESCVVL
jgi:uncharacterized protein YpbB